MMHGTLDLDPDGWTPPRVALIGMGMGRDDLGLNALRWLKRAEVLVGGRRHLELFPEHVGERILLQSPLQEAVERLTVLSETKRTAVLASGDPFFFGIGQRIVKSLGKDRIIAFPNITSVQVLFARLGEPWEDVKVVSLHGREGKWLPGEWLKTVGAHPKTVLFTDPKHTPSWIAEQLCRAGITDRSMVVAEDLGLPTEAVRRFSLEEAGKENFSPLNLVALLPVDSTEESGLPPCGRPVLGLAESAFLHEAGMITKMEVRAVVLAHLQLEPDLVLWDLGAASGSVSIEASRLAPLKQVFAVEKNGIRFKDLAENVKRFRCPEIQPILGSAREMLNGLPDPDRVFIGGSGGDLHDILSAVAPRLRPGGRVVQTAVTLDTLEDARSFWSAQPFETTITQLQINRSVPIGKTQRLESLNPVFIITAWKKG
jgi:precorrin-6Y C5,15-methyltransferase (decarboxylating)